jgi:hypothetical protein
MERSLRSHFATSKPDALQKKMVERLTCLATIGGRDDFEKGYTSSAKWLKLICDTTGDTNQLE